jgi:hypothetical protein
MWREKILTEKAILKISTKTMSERSRLGLSEWTITRMLNGKTPNPRIDSVLDVGETVGLSPQELFSETISVVGDKSYADLLAERDALLETTQSLTVKVEALDKENAVLVKELEHKTETIILKNEIIRLMTVNNS